jgi:hypothetical protein
MSPKKAAAASCQSKNKKQKLDVPTLTDEEKRVVLVQYEKENESDDAESLIVEYLRFMAIKIREEKDAEDKRAAPPKMIDEMWHAHILSTKEYFAFCARHNDGEYIHHDPSMVGVLSRYISTRLRYIELFDDVPKAPIWPFPRVGPPSPVGESESEGYPSDGDPGCG